MINLDHYHSKLKYQEVSVHLKALTAFLVYGVYEECAVRCVTCFTFTEDH